METIVYCSSLHIKSGVIENYIGIGILSTFGKLIESLSTIFVTSQMSNFTYNNFTKGRSTSTEFVNFCVGMMENCAQIDVE